MEQYLDSLVARYRSSGVLVDTSLLLLLYVGLFNPQWIERYTRTRQIGESKEVFTERDFNFISSFVDRFDRIVTTPHILTEVSNFLGGKELHGHVKEGCFQVFAQHVTATSTVEHRPHAESLCNAPTFARFGITDTSIIEVAIEEAAQSYLVLTTDYKLAGHLRKKGFDALNYNHIRMAVISQKSRRLL